MHEEARVVEGFFVLRPIWPIKAVKTALSVTKTAVKKGGQWIVVAINIGAIVFVFLGLPVMLTMLGLEFGSEFLEKQRLATSQKYAEESIAQRNKEIESLNSAAGSKIEQVELLARMDNAWESSSPTQRSTWTAYNHVLPEVQCWLGRNNKFIDPEWYKKLKK